MNTNGEILSPESFIVIVRPRAKADTIDEARQALEAIARPTRANPDCLEFRIFQDQRDTQSFVLVERWTSLEAVLAHGRRSYMADYVAKKDTLFETPPKGDFYCEIEA
jgi:quinol monooxygenase YgiN